jgi:hypothetical protein
MHCCQSIQRLLSDHPCAISYVLSQDYFVTLGFTCNQPYFDCGHCWSEHRNSPPIAFNVFLAAASIWIFTKEIDNFSPLGKSVGVRLFFAMRWQSIAHFTLYAVCSLSNSVPYSLPCLYFKYTPKLYWVDSIHVFQTCGSSNFFMNCCCVVLKAFLESDKLCHSNRIHAYICFFLSDVNIHAERGTSIAGKFYRTEGNIVCPP